MIPYKRLGLIAIPFLLFLFSCQPTFLKKPETANAPDSLLFYQKKDLHDAFLDAVLAQPHEEVMLKHTVVPPPPPAPQFKTVPGFRVQIFASGDSLNALRKKNEVKAIVGDSCLIVREHNLFKVQLGNFPQRSAADSLKEILKNHGFPGAWVVQTTIQIPITAGPSASSTRQKPTSHTEKGPNLKGTSPFRIQVFVTVDSLKARQITEEIKQKFQLSCSFEHHPPVFKIFINGFQTRKQAETILQKIKTSGYKDAWIVHQ